MAKADLHVHSRFSDHPSDWFLQRIGTAESYTDPDYIYRTARSRGMDFVTVTDHNSMEGALLLKELYPDRIIPGVESTAYFPEDQCKIHFLLYGLNETEYREVDRLRTDIYRLRDYVKERKLAYSIAHATYSINNRLTPEHLQKLVLLFDVFEEVNGGRNRRLNSSWSDFLRDLQPRDIDRMYRKYRIEPMSEEPWRKGFTGGSDDHGGLFIGMTWTESPGDSIEEFLEGLRNRRSDGKGRHNDYKGMVFSFYKVAIDFARQKSESFQQSPVSQFSSLLFEDRKMTILDRIKLFWLRSNKADRIRTLAADLIETAQAERYLGKIDERHDAIYGHLTQISDEFIRILLSSLESDIENGNVINIVRNLSAALPGFFLSVPFVTSFKHMYGIRSLVEDLRRESGKEIVNRSPKVLWFTDTLNDLNGVSVTLRTVARLAHRQERDITLVTSMIEEERDPDLPPNILNLEPIHHFPLPYYEKQIMKIPSFMKTLDEIYRLDPDEIIISTPGPIGLIGLALGKLLNVKVSGIYHTDFTMEAVQIVDESISTAMEGYIRWFYEQMDRILVPTEEYIRILEPRGYDLARMGVFRRGMDTETFHPVPGRDASFLQKTLNLKPGFNLIYAGRISKDKNLDALLDVYKRLIRQDKRMNLIFLGDGPYLPELQKAYKGNRRVVFTGKIPNTDLPDYYSAADLFLFPSISDTFGMVILEAHACGLPCIVTDQGGPQEIVQDGETGYVLSAGEPDAWVETVLRMKRISEEHPEQYAAIRKACRDHIVRNYNWNRVLDDISVPRNGAAVSLPRDQESVGDDAETVTA